MVSRVCIAHPQIGVQALHWQVPLTVMKGVVRR